MIELRHLKHLVTFADSGTLREASERLNITQPALTKSLQKLEEQLQVKVLARSGRRLVLTAFGQKIVAHGRRLLQSAQDTERLARQWREGATGELTIGLGPAFAKQMGEELVAQAASRPGHILLQIETGHAASLMQRLLANEIDIIVHDQMLTNNIDDLTTIPLAHTPLKALVRQGHPLTTKPPLTFDDLTCYPIGHSPAPARFEPVAKLLEARTASNGKSLIRTEYHDTLVASCINSDLIILLPDRLGHFFMERNEGLTLVDLPMLPEPSKPQIIYRFDGVFLPPVAHNVIKWIKSRFG